MDDLRGIRIYAPGISRSPTDVGRARIALDDLLYEWSLAIKLPRLRPRARVVSVGEYALFANRQTHGIVFREMRMKTPKKAKPASLTSIEVPGTGVYMEPRPRHELAPCSRPFIFPAQQVQDVAVALKLGMNCMITGPIGCGKSSLPRALAAHLGHPFVRFNAGDLAVCMREGYWVLLDEIDAALSSVRFVLQPVLEEDNRTLRIPETGEVIEAAPGFALFATGNTVGYRAMQRARHSGTSALNVAFLDRFGMVIACDYPTCAEECERVRVNVPACDPDVIDGICRVAAELRADEKFSSDFSTRRCIQWARLCSEYGIEGVLRSAQLAVLRKLESATDAKVAKEVVCRIFGYQQGDL